jgi:putative phosphoesterase
LLGFDISERSSDVTVKSIPKQLGVISDTHGLLRPEAVVALSGSELIIHSGDIGSPDVLEELRSVAPVVAIRGNVDKGTWAAGLRAVEVVEADRASLYVLHDLAALDLDPAAAGFQAVIAGHSHRPGIETPNGVLYVNPGSAGPRRFSLPITVARLEVVGTRIAARIIELHPA